MANPTSVTDGVAVLLAGTDEIAVALDVDREYWIGHDGEDGDGTSSEVTVYLALAAAVTASAAAGANKHKLIPYRPIWFGPGVAELRLKTASGAATASIVAGKKLGGNW